MWRVGKKDLLRVSSKFKVTSTKKEVLRRDEGDGYLVQDGLGVVHEGNGDLRVV